MNAAKGLVVEGLIARYGISPVLRGVDLTVGAGEVVGLIGPNGAGKSTTLRAISGLMRRQATTLTLDGVPLPTASDRVAVRGIAHVPEGRGMLPSLTVEQNLRAGAYATKRALTPAIMDLLFELFPRLADLRERRTGTLSGGEQQMVAIARGLATEPKVLMIDEMSLGLAPKVVTSILTALVNDSRERGLSLLLVDQNVRALDSVCDRLYSLKHGRTALVNGEESEFTDVYFSIT